MRGLRTSRPAAWLKALAPCLGARMHLDDPLPWTCVKTCQYLLFGAMNKSPVMDAISLNGPFGTAWLLTKQSVMRQAKLAS